MNEAWTIYDEIRELHDGEEFKAALVKIGATREQTHEIWDFIAGLEASCFSRQGDLKEGVGILESAVAGGSENYWIYNQLAATYRVLGMKPEMLEALWRSHELRGWPESRKNKYIFTHDFFSANIESWSRWFGQHMTKAPINLAEIGSWQGGSTTWLLDKIIAPRGGMLTSIDTFEGSSEHAGYIDNLGDTLENLFDRNIEATGHSKLNRKIVGKSQQILRNLWGEHFDFIYIGGAHEAKFVLQDAILSWGLIEAGGFLLFDDVDFHFEDNPVQDTHHAIDIFTRFFQDELRIVETGRQMLVPKLVS